MTEDEIVSLRAILPELLLEFGGRLRLDVADACSQAVTYTEQALIGAAVPGLIADGSRREQGDPKRLGAGAVTLCGVVIRLFAARDENYGKKDVERCGQPVMAPHLFVCQLLR